MGSDLTVLELQPNSGILKLDFENERLRSMVDVLVDLQMHTKYYVSTLWYVGAAAKSENPSLTLKVEVKDYDDFDCLIA